MITVAIVTNVAFHIKGRDYGSEDIFLAQELRKRDLLVQLIHPEELLPLTSTAANTALLQSVDVLLFRNNYGGPLEQQYRAKLAEFLLDPVASHTVFNDFAGCKGDFQGKQHLLDLYALNYPVIPTTQNLHDLDSSSSSSDSNFTSNASTYMVKSKTGADSNDMQGHLKREQAIQEFNRLNSSNDTGGYLIQPMVEFSCEISFFYFEGDFMYAVSNGSDSVADPTVDVADAQAAATAKRWALTMYDPTTADLEFAQQFVEWNKCHRQIQRIDACRLVATGALLLMEIEDYNCWLSLQDVEEQRPQLLKKFVDRLALSLKNFVTSSIGWVRSE